MGFALNSQVNLPAFTLFFHGAVHIVTNKDCENLTRNSPHTMLLGQTIHKQYKALESINPGVDGTLSGNSSVYLPTPHASMYTRMIWLVRRD